MLLSISKRVLPIKTGEDIRIVAEAFANWTAWQRPSFLVTGWHREILA